MYAFLTFDTYIIIHKSFAFNYYNIAINGYRLGIETEQDWT